MNADKRRQASSFHQRLSAFISGHLFSSHVLRERMPARELANAPRPRGHPGAALSGSMVYARILAIGGRLGNSSHFYVVHPNGMAFACSGGACFSLPTPACGRILSRLSKRGHDRPEAIVGLAEIGGNAAAGGTTRVLDVVPPCSASRRAAGSALAPLRVYRGRPAVIRRVVPIGAPFVNVLAHVEEAVPVGLAMADGFGAVPPTAGIDGGQFAAPGLEPRLEPSAGGEFPLALGGQAPRPIPLAGEPLAVRRGIEPIHAHHGKRGVAELELSKGGVLRVGHLTAGHAEREHGDAVGGTLVIAPVVLAHEKLAAGDWYQIAWARHS